MSAPLGRVRVPSASLLRDIIPWDVKAFVLQHKHPEFSNRHTDPDPSQCADKPIALPTRVEPKVFFANERTYLSWLNFSVVIGALAIGMLNFGDRVSFISAFFFTLVAMGTMFYATVTYHWRAKSIRKRGQAGFDDRFGPTMLAVALFAVVVINFVLRITDRAKHGKP